MADYKKMYYHLFNTVTDALSELEQYNIGLAGTLLKNGQLACEAIYLESGPAADLPDGNNRLNSTEPT